MGDVNMRFHILATSILLPAFVLCSGSNPVASSTVTSNGITCHNNNPIPPQFPGPQLYDCTPNTAFDNAAYSNVFSALTSLGADAAQRLIKSNGHFFFFKNIADYTTFSCFHPSTNPSPLPCAVVTTAGKTFFPEYFLPFPSPYAFSLIFEFYGSPNGVLVTPWGNVANHEAGHQLDRIYGTVLNYGTKWASDGPPYQTELTKDWAAFNKRSPCGTPSVPGGVFTSQKDKYGNYICGGTNGTGNSLNVSAGYSGNNQTVLQKAWKEPFAAGVPDPTHPSAELFAEEVSFDTSEQISGNQSPDWYFHNQGFQCTRTIDYRLRTYGVLPIPQQYPFGC
jgi:hypothetical protein